MKDLWPEIRKKPDKSTPPEGQPDLRQLGDEDIVKYLNGKYNPSGEQSSDRPRNKLFRIFFTSFISWRQLAVVISCCLILLDVVLSLTCWNNITLPGAVLILIFPTILLGLCLNSESHPLRGDIALIVLFILAFIFDFWGWMAFYCGTKILSAPSHYINLLQLGPFFLLCVFLSYIFLFIKAFWRLFKRKHVEFFLRAGLLVVCSMALKYTPNPDEPPHLRFLSGFEVAVNNQIDTSRIQTWLAQQSLNPDNQPEGNFAYWKNPKGYDEDNNAAIYLIEPQEQPDFVKALSGDESLAVGYDKQNNYYYTGITQYMGNVFIHIRWGLVIGPASSPMSKPSKKLASLLYVKQISPGVYVWRKTDP